MAAQQRRRQGDDETQRHLEEQLHEFPVKLKLFKSLVVSILLYGCKCWTITADLKRRIQAFEDTCYRRLLRISYTEHRSNEFVRQQVTNYAGTTHGHGNWLGMATSPVRRPTALAHHGGEGIHRVTTTRVYDAHGIEE